MNPYKLAKNIKVGDLVVRPANQTTYTVLHVRQLLPGWVEFDIGLDRFVDCTLQYRTIDKVRIGRKI